MSNQIPLDGQSTCDEHMCNRNVHKPFLKCAKASSAHFRIVAHAGIPTSTQTEEPSMATELHIKSSISNTYQQYYIWQTGPG